MGTGGGVPRTELAEAGASEALWRGATGARRGLGGTSLRPGGSEVRPPAAA